MTKAMAMAMGARARSWRSSSAGDGARVAAIVALLAAGGCGGPDAARDASAARDSGGATGDGGASDGGGDRTDGGAGDVDAGALGDGGGEPIDGGAPDGAGAACEDGCGEGRGCLRGVCVSTCGADLAMIDSALAAGLIPVAHACRTASAIDAVVGDDDTIRIYELTSSVAGDATTFVLSRWALVDGAPSIEPVATAMHEATADEMSVFVGGYVAISPDEGRALFGYTTLGAGFVGGVFDLAADGAGTTEVAAPGNFDAAWIDSSRWVVNGLGLGGVASGQGLYLFDRGDGAPLHVASEMGAYSGSVALHDGTVLAGGSPEATWPDGSSGDRVFVFSRGALLGASSAISAWEDADARLPIGGAFEVIASAAGVPRLARAVYDSSFTAIDRIEATAVTLAGEASALGETEVLTTGPLFTGIASAGPGSVLLLHASGALHVVE